jgi:hypothetical protein
MAGKGRERRLTLRAENRTSLRMQNLDRRVFKQTRELLESTMLSAKIGGWFDDLRAKFAQREKRNGLRPFKFETPSLSDLQRHL